ncbi:Hypothetical protein KLENKIAIHU_2565 [Klenkia terrae]|nr:Hypothetical protein KLENKIAIHU_2565 [Klenkia terrae]
MGERSQTGQTVPVEPEEQQQQPAWFVVVLGLGLAVAVAAICFFALAALGAQQVGTGFVVLVGVLSAVVGGFASRSLADKLPPVRRTR